MDWPRASANDFFNNANLAPRPFENKTSGGAAWAAPSSETRLFLRTPKEFVTSFGTSTQVFVPAGTSKLCADTSLPAFNRRRFLLTTDFALYNAARSQSSDGCSRNSCGSLGVILRQEPSMPEHFSEAYVTTATANGC